MPENLTPWTDPEIEARVVALILGEASDFERDQLRELIAGNAELAAFAKRIQAIHGLLHEACGKLPATASPESGRWQLSPEQRRPLLDTLSAASPAQPPPRKRTDLLFRPAFWWSAAACLLLLGILASLVMPAGYQVTKSMKRTDALRLAQSAGDLRVDETRQGSQPALGKNPMAPASPPASPPPPAAVAAPLPAPAAPPRKEVAQVTESDSSGAKKDQLAALGDGFAGGGAAAGAAGTPRGSSAFAYGVDASTNEAITRERGKREISEPSRAEGEEKTASHFGRALKLSAGNFIVPESGTGGTHLSAGESLQRDDAVAERPAPSAEPHLVAPSEPVALGFAFTGESSKPAAPAGSKDQPATATAAPAQMPALIAGQRSSGAPASAIDPKSLLTRAVREKPSGGVALDQFAKAKEVRDLDHLDSAAHLEPDNVKRQPRNYSVAANYQSHSGFLGEIAKQWESAALEDQTAMAEGSIRGSGMDYINEKLKRIVIPELEFENTPLDQALDMLRQKARELDDLEPDPGRRGVNIVLRGGPPAGATEKAGAAPGSGGASKLPAVTLKLSNVPLEEAMRYTTEIAGLKFRADPNALVVQPAGEAAGDLYTQVFRVPLSFEDRPAKPEAGSKTRKKAREILEEAGVTFPPGSSVMYSAPTTQMIVRNTQANLELIEAYVETLKAEDGSPPPPPQVEKRPLEDAQQRESASDFVDEKLKRTVIPEVDFNETPFPTALDFLAQKIRELDPEENAARRGLGFQVHHNEDAKITLKLSNIPAGEALRYLTELAGLNYEVRDGRIQIDRPERIHRNEKLFGYAFKVPQRVFVQAFEEAANPAASGDPFADRGGIPNPAASHRELLESAGIAFPPNSSVRYDDLKEELIVYNTESNLDLVEAYLQSLIETPAPNPSAKPAEPERTPEIATSEEPFSTFSLHVSDVSFKLAQAALGEGKWPDPSRIRIEEFVNAFDYGDPSPGSSEPVACTLEQAIHPFQQARNLLRISLRTGSAGRASATPLRLTLLLDSSGSMERADRRQGLQAAFAQLAGLLHANDRFTLISFARLPKLLADQLPGDQSKRLLEIIAAIPSEGGTNLEAALQLATEKAREHFLAGAQNRVVLLTDGAANLGNADPARLSHYVETMRRNGIAFDTAGIGADGLNDAILEALSRKGDGRYYLLNRPEDADANFATQLAGAFRPAARNVKVQVWFDPERVRRYRLLGFEEHRLKKEDFKDDRVDAAELAAAEAGVALYQFEPLPEGNGDNGYVSVRFQDAATGQMIERRWPIPYVTSPPPFEKAPAALRLAASAAFLAAKLGEDWLAPRTDLSVLDRAAGNEELRTMIQQTRNLSQSR